MNRKSLFFLALSAVVIFGLSSCNKRASSLEVSFDFARQRGPGSNQYAVWVENQFGDVVNNIFVTSFTVKGSNRGPMSGIRGYVYRPTCVPEWLKKADPNRYEDDYIDSFSGATPAEDGPQVFVWDFTDDNGAKVPDGLYTICVNATLHDASTVLWKGSFSTKSKKGPVELEITRNQPDNTDNEGMVSNVCAELK